MTHQEHNRNLDLKKSYRVGIFGVLMTGFTQDYFTPFLLLVGGTTFHVSLLSCLNNLFSSIGQLPSADLIAKVRSRKKIVSLFILCQTAALLAIVLLAITNLLPPSLLIILVVAFTAFGAITHPGWVSILSDMVSFNKRGQYFGWRARNLGFSTIAATFAAGSILYVFNKFHPAYGFIIIMAIAMVLRFLSYLAFKDIIEPPLNITKEDSFSFWQFFKQIKKSNFAQFVLFTASVNFCVNLAAPFFAVLMLEDLKFNYILYMLINIAAPIVLYATINRWGHHADKVGNLKILKFVAPLFGVIPLLWIINQNPLFLIFAEMVSGFLWAGFNLCSSNFIMDAVTPQKRARCYAYFHVVNGFALGLGALLGGLLLKLIPPLFGYKILTLFLISSILRVLVGLVLPRKLKEVRPTERISSQELLFSMIGVKPIAGIERKSVQL